MNSKERLDAFVNGDRVDRLPNLTIIGSAAAPCIGIDVETYCKDPIKMADSAMAAAEKYSLDFIQIASDLARTAEGYGSVLKYSSDALPTVTSYALSDISDTEELKPKKVSDIKRLQDLVTATEYAVKKSAGVYPMTLITGPATTASNMRGMEDLMVDFYDDPESVIKLMRIITDTIKDLIKELSSVGSKYLYSADPIASLLSPSIYKEYIFPFHKEIFGEMEKYGITGRLHMCGNTEAVIPFSSQCGAKIIDVDHSTDFIKALDAVGGRCIPNGNIDPVEDVFSCTAEHTENAVIKCAELIKGRNAMIMPGCELPTLTPPENIKAIHSALCKIGDNRFTF